MELEQSGIYRQLDSKIKIGGMEASDFIFILLVAAILNLIFGRTDIAPWIVFGIPSALAVIVHIGKRGRPDGYLIHLIRYYITPGFYSAGEKGVFEDKRSGKIYD